MKDQLKTDPDFLSKIITGDESWCYGYDQETQDQVNGKVHHLWDQKRLGKSNQMWKPCWSASLTSKGSSTLNSYHKVRLNQQFYLEVLKQLRDAVWRKRPELWRSGEWLLHHDNATAHTALSVRYFLTKNGMRTASHPPTPRTWHPAIFSCFQEWRGT